MILVPAAVLTFAGFHLSDVSTRQPETIIALERGALDRWGKGDPQGYLELYAPEITYFDPTQERRVDGAAAMRKRLAPFTGKIRIDRYEMVAPKVQQRGDVAVLTYNLISHARRPTGDTVTVRWNSTAVYARSQGKWSIIHSHWSFTKPVANAPPQWAATRFLETYAGTTNQLSGLHALPHRRGQPLHATAIRNLTQERQIVGFTAEAARQR